MRQKRSEKEIFRLEKKFYKEIGERLKVFRKMSDLSQAIAAEHISVTFQQMQKYELGTNRISILKLEMLAELYGVSYDAIRNADKAADNSFNITELTIIRILRKIPTSQAKNLKQLIFSMGKRDFEE